MQNHPLTTTDWRFVKGQRNNAKISPRISIDQIIYYQQLQLKTEDVVIPGLSNPDWSYALYHFSPFLYNHLKNHPEQCQSISPQLYIDLDNNAKIISTIDDIFSKRMRQYGMHRAQKDVFAEIMLLDLYRAIPFCHLVLMISSLAKTICRITLDKVWENETVERPAIIAMGKLGAEEVNYSSDIDLVFVCAEESDPIKTIKLLQIFIKQLHQTGEDGFLYRVDTRLRPQGQSGGALVRTVASYMDYYWNSGQTWERQALLKASFLTGNEQIGNKFLQETRKFIYFQNISPKQIREIQEIKKMIEGDLAVKQSSQRNIKLMRGGIRDIEFMVQLLQLHHGFVYPELRDPNHIQATRSLASHNFIADPDELIQAYVLFREIEHRLQCKNFSPVRLLPESEEEWDLLLISFPEQSAKTGKELQDRLLRKSVEIGELFQKTLDSTLAYMKKFHDVLGYMQSWSLAEVSGMLHGFRDEYIDFFMPIEIADHFHRLQKITSQQPVNIFVDPTHLPDFWKINLVGVDTPFIFSYMVGELSILALELQEAKSFTYRSLPHRKYKDLFPELPMVSHMLVQGLRSNIESWCVKIRNIFQQLAKQKTGDKEEIKQDLRRRFFERTVEAWVVEDTSQDFSVVARNPKGSYYTILEIKGRNYSGFLFESITVLQELGIKLIQCDVATKDGIAFDRFKIVRLDDTRIPDQQLSGLEQRLSLMKFFSRHLGKVADPASAYQHFFMLVGNLQPEGFSEHDHKWINSMHERLLDESTTLNLDDNLLEKVGLLLGSGEFVRQRFFLSEGLYYLKLASQNFSFDVDNLISELNALPIFNQINTLLEEEFSGELRLDNIFIKNLRDTLLRQLANWREKALYDICIQQVKGNLTFFQLSECFDRVITVYLQKLIVYYEITQLFLQGKNVNDWCRASRWALLGLGKFGGRELGYGSDLEVILVYDYNNAEDAIGLDFWYAIVRMLTKELPNKTNNLFNLDLRLRPHGKAGPLASSINQFSKYYTQLGFAHALERQALIKARIVARREFAPENSTLFDVDSQIINNHLGFKEGNAELLTDKIEAVRLGFTFSPQPFQMSAILNLHEEQKMKSEENHLKFGRGGLVEIEYSVQMLQIGAMQRQTNLPEILREKLISGNTLEAIGALGKIKIISAYEEGMLIHYYCLFRVVINALRFSIGRDDAYVLPQFDSPAWVRLWRLVRSEISCSDPAHLYRLLESAQIEIANWWQKFIVRLPINWQSTEVAKIE